MTDTIAVHFDGRVLVPDEPISLPTGSRLRVRIESVDEPQQKFASLLDFAADLPDAPPDLAGQHDHYLTGAPKR
jgi:hypothetical protein